MFWYQLDSFSSILTNQCFYLSKSWAAIEWKSSFIPARFNFCPLACNLLYASVAAMFYLLDGAIAAAIFVLQKRHT